MAYFYRFIATSIRDMRVFSYHSRQRHKIFVHYRRITLAQLNSVLTIPKLELQAAVIASRIKCKIVDESQITVNDIYFCSDSQTVLKYIKNENQRFSAYIMRCVNEIKSNSNKADWYYSKTAWAVIWVPAPQEIIS